MSVLTQTYRARQKVLGYPVDLIDERGALRVIEEAWDNRKSLSIVTLNAEMVIAAQSNQHLDRIVRHAHLIVPDGAGVVWALRLAGHKIERLPGIELAEATLKAAAATGKRVALVGGKPPIIEQLTTVLVGLYPGLKIVAATNGYFSEEDEQDVIGKIADAEPDLLLVALGVPKQEYFLERWQNAFLHAVMIGVGGSFDVWTGTAKRAPALFRRLHSEWLYRLLSEPWRYKRMASALPSFAIQVLRESTKNKLVQKNAHSKRRKDTRLPKDHDKSRERSKDR